MEAPETRYVAVGDADVAYQVVGDGGPLDLRELDHLCEWWFFVLRVRVTITNGQLRQRHGLDHFQRVTCVQWWDRTACGQLSLFPAQRSEVHFSGGFKSVRLASRLRQLRRFVLVLSWSPFRPSGSQGHGSPSLALSALRSPSNRCKLNRVSAFGDLIV
jgi:hypothetical protein